MTVVVGLSFLGLLVLQLCQALLVHLELQLLAGTIITLSLVMGLLLSVTLDLLKRL
jgi:hypothetical protein